MSSAGLVHTKRVAAVVPVVDEGADGGVELARVVTMLLMIGDLVLIGLVGKVLLGAAAAGRARVSPRSRRIDPRSSAVIRSG